MNDEDAFEHFANLVAERVISILGERMTFPTAEDVERIRDHVSPNGVAFRNGWNAALETIAEDAGPEYSGQVSGIQVAAYARSLKK